MRVTRTARSSSQGPEAFVSGPRAFCGPYRARTDDLLGVNQTL